MGDFIICEEHGYPARRKPTDDSAVAVYACPGTFEYLDFVGEHDIRMRM